MRDIALFLLAFITLSLVFAEIWLSQNRSLRVFKAHIVGCYDGNTCRFTLPSHHPILGEGVQVQIVGLQTPKLREPTLSKASSARDAMRGLLERADDIFLVNTKRKNRSLHASVCANGKDMAKTRQMA